MVRSALCDDLPGMLQLYCPLSPDDPAPDEATASAVWETMLAMPGMTVFVAEVPGVNYPAATCTLLTVPNLTHGAMSQGLIENVVTRARHRKRGLGRAVVDTAVAFAWRQGCYRVTLTTGTRRKETLRFYKQAGFARGIKTAFEMRQNGAAS